MKLTELMQRESYKDARKRITAWKQRIERAEKADAVAIESEVEDFFSKLESSDKDVHRLLQADRKILRQRLMKIITGKEVIID